MRPHFSASSHLCRVCTSCERGGSRWPDICPFTASPHVGAHSKFQDQIESRDRAERAADRGIGRGQQLARAGGAGCRCDQIARLDHLQRIATSTENGCPVVRKSLPHRECENVTRNDLLKAIYQTCPKLKPPSCSSRKIVSVEETGKRVTVKTDTGEIISGDVFASRGSVVGPTCSLPFQRHSKYVPNVVPGLEMTGGGPFDTLVSSWPAAVVPLALIVFFGL